MSHHKYGLIGRQIHGPGHSEPPRTACAGSGRTAVDGNLRKRATFRVSRNRSLPRRWLLALPHATRHCSEDS